MTQAELRSLDLTTLNVVQELIVSHLQSRVCQWEQEASDAARDDQLSVALMKKNWAYAADVVACSCSGVMSRLFLEAHQAQGGHLEALQPEPEPVAA